MNLTIDQHTGSDVPEVTIPVILRRIDSPHDANAGPDPKLPVAEAGEAALVEETGEASGGFAAPGESLLEVEEPTSEMIAAVSGESLEVRREQLQLHVAQLAGHLRERLREVDRREAAVHARASQLESDIRASRLWLQEREIAFQERERELRGQIEELEERASSRPLETVTEATYQEPSLADLQEREQQIRVQEDEVRERRFAVEREAVALRHAQSVWQHEREREERALVLERDNARRELQELTEQHELQLRAAETLLGEHVEQFDRDRASLMAERREWDEQRSRQQQALADLRAATEGDLADDKAKLAARQEWIERQKAGLEQVRDEALRLHRQSLEMRLMAEQLWAQVSGTLTPAELTQSIAQMRIKLAEQYRLEEQQLTARREELLKVGEAVSAQHAELEQLRTGIREWMQARQEEIERQASSLVERELALDSQQDAHRCAERQWQAARRGYEQQIRELMAQLRTVPMAA